ncbi:MAG: ABC transporter permease [Anaerolineales bacterium]|nr:ABC transporter permease [Anaerolineales bacterium]MBS3752114.1 ABC transporter permease [Anaerolineales bacterium]
MSLWQAILEALESLLSNKLRSALTILGIVIGVAAVIAMLGIGAGAEETITGEIQGVGTNLLFVIQGGSSDVRNPKPLTLGDADAIADSFAAPSVAGVSSALRGSVEVSKAGETARTSVLGVTANYNEIGNVAVREGEFINENHILGRSSVILLGTDVAEDLFGTRSGLVGEIVRVEGQNFRVIGVLEEKGGSAFSNQDDQVLVPLTTAQIRLMRRSNRDQVDVLYVQTQNAEVIPRAKQEISQILRKRHRTELGEDDFTIISQQDIISVASSITNVLTIFLGGIAAISLLVGGIGIMNIMLVSVVERTREIGLRKALGATKLDILFQFLAESLLLSLVGGVVGIGFGWLISSVVGRIAAANDVSINPVISLQSILLATIFSIAVGLFFGIYPANRAASLQPVEALRYE